MKKLLPYIIILFLFANCGSKTEETKTSTKSKIKEPQKTEIKTSKTDTVVTEKLPEKENKKVDEQKTATVIPEDSVIRNLHMVSQPSTFEVVQIELEFEPISEQEYLKSKSDYDKKIDLDNHIEFDSTSFSFKTSKSKYRLYKPNPNDGHMDYKYVGFLKPLNSYIITGGGQESFDMFLVNKDTDLTISLLEYDDDCPLISPQHSKLLMHYYSPYEVDEGSYITIFQINDDKTISGLQLFGTNEWQSEEIVWINEFTIALKVCEEIKHIGNGERECIGTKYLKSNMY